MRLPLYTCCALFFAFPALAQGERQGTEGEILDARAKEKLIEAERAEMERAREATAGVPEEDVDLTPHPGLERYIATIVSVRPERIAPGQAGIVHIVLAMHQSNLVQAGAHMTLTYEEQQGPLQLGEWRIEDPAQGKLETAFRGQMVYDNTAVITVPVAVALAARHEPHAVTFELETDVTHADTGRVRGRFKTVVNGRVPVGLPIPTPMPMPLRTAANSGGAPGGAEPPTDDGTAIVDPEEPDRAARGGPDVLGARQAPGESAREPAESGPDGVGSGPLDEGGGLPTWIFYAVGVLAIGLLTVIVAGRRS